MKPTAGNDPPSQPRTTGVGHAFSSTRAYDLIAASPLVIWCSLAAAGCLISIMHILPKVERSADAVPVLQIVQFSALFLFLVQQTILVFVRRLPGARAAGVLPRLAAIFGAYLGLAIVGLPRVELSPDASAVSITLVVLGTVGATVSLFYLGRSFSLMPQARGLVTAGPYRFVRHPIYLAEQIAVLGVMLQFKMPWSAALAVASLVAQFPRMHYEEKVLGDTYPAYSAYARRTARLLPGLY